MNPLGFRFQLPHPRNHTKGTTMTPTTTASTTAAAPASAGVSTADVSPGVSGEAPTGVSTARTGEVSGDLSADNDYAAAGFGQRLGFGRRPALIVIDFVDAYLVESSPLYAGVEDELASAARVLHSARAAGIPVLYTVVEQDTGPTGGGVFARKAAGLATLATGSPLGAIAAPLTPQQGEPILSKKYASSFFGTSLATDLTVLGCDSVILVGLSTSGCVRATAVDACQHGFIPLVVRDAVGDRRSEPHEAALFDLDAKYADVVSEQDVVTYLAGLAASSA
ncbi:Isochorismatase [Pseudoclavibacter sp. 8L]|nr:Isochorismatase [Pseudoclavibacter sp. 8L]